MDATLLETEYDAVIVGTGMAEAILAGALARVGKKVLHLDQNDYYGSQYASFPLEQFLRWTRNEEIAPRPLDEDEDKEDASQNDALSAEEQDMQTPRDATIIPLRSSFQCHLVHESFSENVTAEKRESVLKQSSRFSIDINPRLVLSSEEIVQILITSGVGRYLEFAALERTYVHFESQSSGSSTSDDSIWEVPCSKRDVFASKLLGMVEKRMLMKFLQFVADYGETHIRGEDVASKNERELALGRSLKRPQNKVNQVDPSIAVYLDRPFQDLLSQHFKLSAKLQQVVTYCVALASFPVATNASSTASNHVQQVTAREGLASVYRYVASIGRFTGNAFLVPLYGVSEITQSFCRLCAVYGGIYVLRAPIDAFVLSPDHTEEQGEAELKPTKKSVIGVRCCDGRLIRAKNVVANPGYLASFGSDCTNTTSSQVLRGVYLLSQSLRTAMDRFMVVFPPEDKSLQNPFAVQAIQLDHGAFVCPADTFLVQITTPLPTEWRDEKQKQQELMTAVIKMLVENALAEKAKSEPVPETPAVVDTTEEGAAATSETSLETEDQEGAGGDGKPVEPIGEAISATAPGWRDLIVWQAVYTMDHYLFHYSNATKQASYSSPDGLPSNLWVSESSFGADTRASAANPLEINLESACVNARAIFEQMCPGEEFLPKSASAEQAEKDEQDDEDDAVLKAATKLAEQAALSRTHSENGTNLLETVESTETLSSKDMGEMLPGQDGDSLKSVAAPVTTAEN